MSTAGSYLYGFTDRRYQAEPELRGLAGAPLHALTYGDVSAIVSPHPVQRLAPSRRNLEPHHRIVRHISSVATLVPAAFGHISGTDADLLAVIRENYDDIRRAILRLDRKCEMSVKLSWSVKNIFLYFVQRDPELREMRDRAYGHRAPSMQEKLEIGGRFEALLKRDRDRCTDALVHALSGAAVEVAPSPARHEKGVSDIAVLVERAGIAELEAAVGRAATLFDQNFKLEYSGPWPAYSFVQLRLQAAGPVAA
jgi:hypothetical protein